MSNSPDETDSVGDPGEDGQLTIRIPNPKVYMARQSQWKGRRGKPRCDHCRLNNLKCDRVLPTCNYCSWASGRECKYTPLPTPAHRGIPRCDRCRTKNRKCDRNLPVCNHCEEEDGVECNYTPKKRHKVPEDHGIMKEGGIAPYTAKTASFLVSDMAHLEDGAASSMDDEDMAEADASPSHKAENGGPSASSSSLPPLAPKSKALPPPPLGPRPCFLDHRALLTPPRIEPWSHSAFAALPETVLHHLRAANAMEMPPRQPFEEALVKFLSELSAELRETASFSPDVYADLSTAISAGDFSKLSPRRQNWLECHHIRCGSKKHHLLLLPRDPYFQMDRAEEEKLRLEYVARTDAGGDAADAPTSDATTELHEAGPTSLEWTAAYERIPVQSQIYDVLVYAHRTHGSSPAMLFETRRVGMATITWPMVEIFTRLCPLCNLRAKAGAHGLGLGLGEPMSMKR
ncbi:hypothetical protein JAAARDRAFT_35270 [Jaapia argillacea MUCL 33604]|uniref:Zn(2)-C6 fungal-type domain-containing protein n=1 Tax=Jaapia argillacea MUCL 33604 TaxID=933084 RepID=A0A067Q265_9AGAM|nr:hypothetical protein JAAARDRAFT_35270 [Jaapia argillacea MUCL 33604]